jgi:hypothetical protein
MPAQMFYGRHDDPADYIDSSATPVVYAPTRIVHHGPAAPPPYDAPPLPPYDPPYAPRHFLPPYEYGPEPPAHTLPPEDLYIRGPLGPPPLRRRPRHGPPPEEMVIPGVQHPDGRFEPHPYYAKRSAHGHPESDESEEEEEEEEHGKNVSESSHGFSYWTLYYIY